MALDEFSVEESLPAQEPIPITAVSDLISELDWENSGCEERNAVEALEATRVRLNTMTKTILVKPKSWCLCGVYYCPIWIYQLQPNGAQRIWSTKGTSGIEILDKTSKGYRQIRESGGTAGHSYMRVWKWDGMKYKVIKEKYTTTPQN